MLHIGIPTKSLNESNNICTVTIPLNISGVNKSLWYSFPSSFEEFLSLEVADAYVVALLIYAMQHQLDIKSELPISELLLHSLEKELIPFFDTNFSHLHPIRIYADSFNGVFRGEHSGTGISRGVDSLSTILNHGIFETNNAFKIDTLTLLNTGYYSSTSSFNKSLSQSKDFAEQFGYSFLNVDTNISQLTNYVFRQTHTFLTNSAILLFQKYFRNYYYASGYPVSSFKVSKDYCAYFDIFSLKNISTQSLTFHSGCATYTRVQKTEMILHHSEFSSHLFVCNGGGDGRNNCSECEKCIRTMLTYEALGARDRIKYNFDIKTYEKQRIRYLSFALRQRHRNIYYKEIIDAFKENGIKIPIAAHLCIVPCKFELNRFKSKLVSTKLGKIIYSQLKH